MTKILLVIAGILVTILIILAAFLFLFKAPSTVPVTTTSTSSGFPLSANQSTSSSNNVGLLTIINSQGQSLSVSNFENDPATKPDPSNKGYYYLSGGTNETVSSAPYQIFYQAPYQYFGITLYKEPLGQYRQQAEQELMQKLGLTQDEMCSLNYDISAGPGVSPTYSSENLGFSFCPGAVALP